ncbi:Regulator of nonsense transcripts [Phytophthora fragariae]|uniref:Regulator of nonsense transcripts n=1 Tax=Phytophthora fragariae TaxID=53985 RepID=A0A6A4DVG1_9STRA|nr:Regulator of nonsense transcripts [Phytophthora fragariae]
MAHDDEEDEAQMQALAQLQELTRLSEARQALRAANCAEGVLAARAQLASLKLKSDIKRSSAFVKKLRVLSESNADSLLRDAAELNLTRYVSECVAALADAPLKVADLAAAVKVSSLLHQRYEDFAPGMERALMGSFEASDDKSKMLRRRLLLRLLCELYLAGVLDDVQVIAHIVQRVARREQPGPSKRGSKGNMSVGSGSSQQLEVPLLVSFAKSVGVDFLGVQPKKYKDMEKQLADTDELRAFVDAQTPVVPKAVQQQCLACYLEAYEMICKFYLAQHATFLKLDARNEKEEANRGEVTDEHVQELKNAKLLFEKLQTSVNSLADALDREVPPLPVEEKDDGPGRGGILVWEGEGGGRELSRDGPFDDEATRSFYEDLPDLLELVPAVVLGLTEADVAELKKKKEAAANADEEADAEIEDEAEGNADEGGDADDATLEEIEADAAKDPAVTDADEEESKSKDEADDASAITATTSSGATNSYHHQLDAYFTSLEDLVNRDRCDKAAVEFCYRNSKATRNRLIKTLYAVPRTHLELLAHYARLVATLQSVLKEDIGGELVGMLVGEFHGLIKRRNQFRLESKIKNIRFLAELVKFRICPPNTGFRCLQKCFQDFQGHNVHVATTFLENCGRFLYCSKHTHARTVNCVNVMMKLKAAKHLDPQLETLVENAYYMCKPPERVERQVKQYDPMYLFLIKVLYQDLNGSNVNKAVKTLRRLPWQESSTCGMVLKALLKVTKGKVMQMKWICEVVKGLSRYHDEVLVLLVDDVLEYIRYGLEVNDYRDHQRSLGYVKLLGEIYNCGLVSMNVVVETLYLLINHSHDLLTLPQYSSDKIPSSQLLEMKKRFLLVPDMRYDPRVPSEVDGPSEVFRVRLVSALIETCNGSGSASVTGSSGNSNERGISRPRLGRFMTFFQRYLLSKTDVPMETDFVVFDLFEMLSISLKDHFKKFETWEEVDQAVREILRGDLEEAERRLSKKNAALVMATNGLESVAGEGSLSQPGDDDDEFLEDEDDTDDEDEDDDEDEHDDDDQAGGDDGEEDDEDDDDEDDDEDDGDEEEEDEEEHLIIHDRIQKSEEDDEFEKAFKSMMHGGTDTRKPAARVNVDKMAIPTVVKSTASLTPAGPRGMLALDANGPPDGVVFRMLRRGNKGKVEARHLVVPEASSLAQHSHRQENAGKKEQSELKRLVLQNMERDDFINDGPPLEGIPSFGPPPRANANYGNPPGVQQPSETRVGFGGGSEWNNAEFGLRRGKGYRGMK